MKRTDLLTPLKQVKPALGSKEMVQVTTCFCFDGETVVAHNERVTLRAPCKMPVQGAIKGQVMLNFLSAVKAKELHVSDDDGTLLIKAGRSKLTAAILPPDDFLHEFPGDDEKFHVLREYDALAPAIGRALITMGLDPGGTLGLLLEIGRKHTKVYSCDGSMGATRVVCASHISAKSKTKTMLLQLDPVFCEVFNDLLSSETPAGIRLNDQWIEVKFKSGLLLLGSLIDSGIDRERFTEIFGYIDEIEAPCDLPKGFASAIERALVVWQAPTQGESYDTKLRVKDGKLRFSTDTPLGRVEDAKRIGEHPDVSLKLSPVMIKQCLPGAERFKLVSDTYDLMLLYGDGFIHAIAVRVED